jgi:hypothetical protein
MGAGTYIYPTNRAFLNLSGGTVTGVTYFTSGLSASTLSAITFDLYGVNTSYNFRFGGLVQGADSTGFMLYRTDSPSPIQTLNGFAWYYGGQTYPQRFASTYASFGSFSRSVQNNSAFLNVAGSLSGKSSFSIESGDTVVNPFEGDIWNDGSHLYGKIGGSVKQLDNDGATSLNSTYVGWGSASNQLSGSSSLTWNDSTKILSISGTGVGYYGTGTIQINNGTYPTTIYNRTNDSNFGNPFGNGAFDIATYSTAGMLIGTVTNTPFAIGTNNTERLRIENNGIVRTGQFSGTTITGNTIWGKNNAFYDGGNGAILISDNQSLSSRTFSLGYTSNYTAKIYNSSEFILENSSGSLFLPFSIRTSSVDVYGYQVIRQKLRVGSNTFQVPVQSLEVVGSAYIDILSAVTASATTINSSSMISTGSTRMVEANSGGTLSATKEIIEEWLYDGLIIGYLESSSNWSALGVYTGTTITNTYRGQKHYDDNYLYIAVADNTWRRTNFV